MDWWIWIMIGFAFLAAETVTPGGFFAFFFGVSAILVGILDAIGISGPAWGQWLLFSLLSVAMVLFVRPTIASRFAGSAGGNTPLPELVGNVAVLLEDLEPGAVAKAELRGTSWSVRSRHGERIARGTRTTVERVEGLTLWIVP
ncbi:MAG TPA: NfeD family protein [Candidatus Limnocylindrales bacterium]|nr:NfeD family protein [Candidatus Limnocylindrales bacterium]